MVGARKNDLADTLLGRRLSELTSVVPSPSAISHSFRAYMGGLTADGTITPLDSSPGHDKPLTPPSLPHSYFWFTHVSPQKKNQPAQTDTLSRFTLPSWSKRHFI